MSIIYVLIPIAMIFVLIAVGLFFWAVKSEQFDDLERQSLSILFDDAPTTATIESPNGDIGQPLDEMKAPDSNEPDVKSP
jgi:cbb3-type cytochrome oxidase maturation protein